MNFLVVPVTAYSQNCTFVTCDVTGVSAVIDPGGQIPELISLAEERGIRLEKILLTHGHLDHCGGAAQLAEDLNIPIIGPHKDDQFWIDQLPEQSRRMGFDTSSSFSPQQWLNDGDQVTVGKLVFDVIHCPGHTPGHVVFINREAGWAQVGDVIFQGSIGRTDFPRSNHEDLIHSIREKLFPLGDEVEFVPGHGPMSSFGQERLTNPFVADKRFG